MDEASFQKRSLNLKGHKTSVALERAFWKVLEDLARAHHISLPHLINEVDEKRTGGLASALRLFALKSVLRK